MKRLLIISIVFCLAGFVFADASDITSNVFYQFGNCEGGRVFVTQSERAGTTLTAQTEYTVGVVGACVEIVNTAGRIEGYTVQPNIEYAGLSGTDVDLSFYLKILTPIQSSYPRLGLRQNPAKPEGIGDGAIYDSDGYMEFWNTNWIYDSAWHQFILGDNLTPNADTTSAWDTITTADFHINDYFAKTFYIDEIVLKDPTPTDASDDVWNVFAAFGDCEDDVWVEATVDCTVPNFLDAQNPTTGVVGMCSKLDLPPPYIRANASTLDGASAGLLSESDAVLKFFYKSTGGLSTSYPWIYFRQDVLSNTASLHPDAGATKVANWNAAGTGTGIGLEPIIRDSVWHLFQPDISDFFWTGQTADLALNHLGPSGLTSEFYIDEISLTDATPPATGMADWGLY